MAEVLMPKLSDTMEEGKILRWLKRPGERVEEGDLLVEVETDKADMEVEATVGGVLREVRIEEGESGRVGDVIAVIDDGAAEGDRAAPRPVRREASARDRGEERAPADDAEAEATESGGAAASDADSNRADARGTEPEPRPRGEREGGPRAVPTRPRTAKAGRAPAEPAPPAVPTAKGKVRVSPLARSRAAELGVDPERVRGTGPGGRVIRRDVEAAAGVEEPTPSSPPEQPEESPAASRRDAHAAEGASVSRRDARREEPLAEARPAVAEAKPKAARAGGAPVTRPAPGAPSPSPRPTAAEGARSIPLSPMRASIARRMTESKREAPHFYLNAVVDMSAAHDLREAMRTSETVASIVTFNHMIVKAAADALAAHPDLNARFAGNAVELLDGIHVGIATAVPDGLIVPVIHDADRKSLVEIATAARALAEKARSRSFTGDELSGATFTVSNLGMYGVDSFAAVINPPQAAILAVGAVAERAVVRGGALVAAHTVTLTLSCDHRAVDGARGAEFLRDLRLRLENPARLLFAAATADA
jgi:pyruvate dehydrogenase E2 component (dihydrolipoamide acetyltransferase)